MHGQGKLTYADGSSYTGEFANDLRHGVGKYVACDGSIKEGLWKDDNFQDFEESLFDDIDYFS